METKQSNTQTKRKLRTLEWYFNHLSLLFYDFFLYGFISKYAWSCPVDRLGKHYQRHITNNHLEVGVGTGYLLKRVEFSNPNPRLALMDLSKACLEKSLKRLSTYQPSLYVQNILEPIAFQNQKFDSVGINYVLHCVPGDFSQKAVAFAHLKELLNDDGVLFGTTVLAKNVKKNVLARLMLSVLNKIQLFNNTHDSPKDLLKALQTHFHEVEFNVIGTTAFFSARKRPEKIAV